jgi:hypothetical protein
MLSPPQPGYPPIPESLAETESIFGHFTFAERPGALIAPDKDWVLRLIVGIRLPIVNQRIECHDLMQKPLLNVFTEIRASNLGHEVRSCEGCYWPRHKMHDPRRELSLHSWGIAIDINARTNMPDTDGDMHSEVINIFGRHGFYWGGNFRDPMHFQYARGC